MVAAPSILETHPSRAAGPSTLEERPSWLVNWSQRGWLAITPTTTPADTSLEEWLKISIDRELSDLGAGPRLPYVGPSARAVLEDQIYRAKMLGFQGLALQLPSLTHFARDGVLSSKDSLALVSWCNAAVELEAPVKLCTDDGQLRIFLAPVPLLDAPQLHFPVISAPEPMSNPLSLVAPTTTTSELAPESDVHASALTAASPPERRVSGIEALAAPIPPGNVSRRAAMRSLLEEDDSDGIDFAPLGDLPRGDVRATRGVEPPAAGLDSAVGQLALVAEIPRAAHGTPTSPEHSISSPEASDLDGAVASFPVSRDQPSLEEVSTDNVVDAPSSASLLDDDGFSEHVENLQTAGGSHGWDGIEQMFDTHYLPLQKSVREGSAPALAAAILAEWAKDFAESYERAFDAIRNNRGKRPRLVLDVPSYAFQLSRRHSAEHVKLVLVDAMRADIGAIVRDKLRLQMANTAECVASGLLWAALPANTSAQMELIARGTDGLRHFSGELSEAQLMSRGNDLRRLRPVRVGSHRMYKLDIVQYLARDVERHTSENLEQYAAEVATSVGRFLRQQEAGTLVYVFGDHGFGGASDAAPEQVLTSYQAWFVNN